VDFVHRVAPKVVGIVVHCHAGISRSGAVAKWIAEQYKLDFNQDYQLFNKHVYRQLVEAEQRTKKNSDVAG
jgi:predicted protein tyrosine phosphatase